MNVAYAGASDEQRDFFGGQMLSIHFRSAELYARLALGAEEATLLGIDERSAAIFHQGRWQALGEGAVTLVGAGLDRRFVPGQAIDGLPVPRIA